MTLALDLSGTAPDNLISSERQNVTSSYIVTYGVLFTKNGPFYSNGFKATVIVGDQTRTLTQGVDYWLVGELLGVFGTANSSKVYGGIFIADPALVGILELTYQALGGNIVVTNSKVMAFYSTSQNNKTYAANSILVPTPSVGLTINNNRDLNIAMTTKTVVPMVFAYFSKTPTVTTTIGSTTPTTNTGGSSGNTGGSSGSNQGSTNTPLTISSISDITAFGKSLITSSSILDIKRLLAYSAIEVGAVSNTDLATGLAGKEKLATIVSVTQSRNITQSDHNAFLDCRGTTDVILTIPVGLSPMPKFTVLCDPSGTSVVVDVGVSNTLGVKRVTDTDSISIQPTGISNTYRVYPSGKDTLKTAAAFKTYDNPDISSLYLEGYASRADGGEGYFDVTTSAAYAEDLGVVFIDALGRRWLRRLIADEARFEHYGIFPVKKRNSTVSATLLTNNTTRWANACRGVILRGGGTLVASVGYYHVNGVGILSDENNLSVNINDNYDKIIACVRGAGKRSVVVQNHPIESSLRIYGYVVEVTLKDMAFWGRGSNTRGDLVEAQDNVGLRCINVAFIGHGGCGFLSMNAERMTFTDCAWTLCRKAYIWFGATNESYIYNQQVINCGTTFDQCGGGGFQNYSINAQGPGSFSLKSSGTVVQDHQVACSIDGPQNVRMIGGSIKTTQAHAGHRFMGENIQIDNLYYEGFGSGVNPSVIVGGKASKTELSSAILASDMVVPVVDAFNFPRRCNSRAAAVMGGAGHKYYAIYDRNDPKTYEYVKAKCLDWQTNTVLIVERNVSGSTATMSQQAWPAGSIFIECFHSTKVNTGFVAEVYFNDVHLESYQGSPAGTTLDYDCAKSNTVGEVILGYVLDEFNTIEFLGGVVAHAYFNKPTMRTYGTPYSGKVQHWANGISHWMNHTHIEALNNSIGPIKADGSSPMDSTVYGQYYVNTPCGSSIIPNIRINRFDVGGDEYLFNYMPMIYGKFGVGFADTSLEMYRMTAVSGANTATLLPPVTGLHSSNKGRIITHPAFPAGTYITDIVGSTVTLSNPASKTLSDTLKVKMPWIGRYSWDTASGGFEILQNFGTGSSDNWRKTARLGGNTLSLYDYSTSSIEQVLGPRVKGFSQMTGTAYKGTLDVATATNAQLAAKLKALEDALYAHGIIGN
jgi:hypothetical protein